jgi:hypothetical protein
MARFPGTPSYTTPDTLARRSYPQEGQPGPFGRHGKNHPTKAKQNPTGRELSIQMGFVASGPKTKKDKMTPGKKHIRHS